MNIITLSTLAKQDIIKIWERVGNADLQVSGTVGWSFEGNGIRTRTTFIEAFRRMGLQFTELPNLLKTAEAPRDLAGYLDPFFQLYVIRESNHERLAAFAAASTRPVINAMSSQGHPCEVLTDAYFIRTELKPLPDARICLWGPTTNVFRSWHELAEVFGLHLTQICERRFHLDHTNVTFLEAPAYAVDVVITDAWPTDVPDYSLPLTAADLQQLGMPAFLPTPPFRVGGELRIDPLDYPGFTGYRQKQLLLPVQQAILHYALTGG